MLGVSKSNVALSSVFIGVNMIPMASILIFDTPYWVYSVTAWLLLVSVLYFYKRKNGTLNHPYLYFMISTIICLLAYILIYPLDNNLQQTILSFDQTLFRQTFSYQIVCIIALGSIGLLFGLRQNYENVKAYKLSKSDHTLRKHVITVSKGMIVIGTIGLVLFLSIRLPASLEYGYGGILNNESVKDSIESADLAGLAKALLIPGLLLMLIAYKDSKKKRRYIIAATFIVALMSSLVGARINIIIPMIVLVWLYVKEIRAIRMKRALLFVPVIILMIAFMIGIREVRDMQDRGASDYIAAVTGTLSPSAFSENIIKTVKEFGINYYSLYETIRIVPSEQGFGLGRTYLLAIPYLVPPIRNIIGADNNYLHIWLKDKNQLEYDPAYTAVAESYYNFGFLGVFAVLMMGYFVLSFFKNEYRGLRKSVRNAFVAIAMITILIGAVTHQFQHTLTLLLLTIGLPYISLILLNRRSLNGRDGQ